ncbi:MAG: hypothetical protein LBC72_03650 [Spirochaetaceae bacterium]|jgi:hypothetical protein|nr:hypothetical protein [Spirochaetaceae bacterium]
MKKLFLLFVLAVSAPCLFAVGKKAPDISAAVFAAAPPQTAGANVVHGGEVRLIINWERVDKPFGYTYALYRARQPQEQTPPEIYYFVQFLPLPDSGSVVSYVFDGELQGGGDEYWYQIFYSPAGFSADESGQSAPIPVRAIPAHVNPKKLQPARVAVPVFAPPSPAAPTAQTAATAPPPAGLYTGILTFADGLEYVTKKNVQGAERGTLAPLASRDALRTLLARFEAAYRPSQAGAASGGGPEAALEQAARTIAAMARDSELPRAIDSIDLVLITGSPAHAPAEGAASGAALRELASTAPLTVWLFGVEDGESAPRFSEAGWNRLRERFGAYGAEGVAGNVPRIEQDLANIALEMERRGAQTHLFAAMPPLPDGARVTIHVGTAGVISALVRQADGESALTAISAEPPALLLYNSGTVPYGESAYAGMHIEKEAHKGYEFILNGNFYDGVEGVSQAGRISADGAALDGEASFINLNPYKAQDGQKTRLVYFVVDNSAALGEAALDGIRGAVCRAIEELYARFVAGERPPATAARPPAPATPPAPAAQPAPASPPPAESAAAPPAARVTNPPVPQRRGARWPADFAAFVRKFDEDKLPWRTKTSNNSPLASARSGPAAGDFGWYIQIGAYADHKSAEAVRVLLEAAGFSGVFIYQTVPDTAAEKSGVATALYKVHIGAYDDAHIQEALRQTRGIWQDIRAPEKEKEKR